MKTSPRLLAVLLALSVLPLAQILYPGCAMVTSGVMEKVRVKSKPTGARVFLNGKEIGVTPVTGVVSRWGFHRVRIELEGYKPYEVRLEKSLNGNVMGNVFIGGVWIVVDAVTGAIFYLDVSPEARRGLLEDQWEKGDPRGGEILTAQPLIITVGLHPLGPARKIGQMERRKK